MSGRTLSSHLANQIAGGVWSKRTTGRHQSGRSLRTMVSAACDKSTSWLVYALFLPIALLNNRTAQRLLLAALIIDIPLQLGTHLDFQEDAAAVGSLGGFDVSLTTIALVGLYLSWWTGSLVRADHRLQPPVRISLWPVLYIFFAALSTVVARDVRLSWFELFLLLQMLLLYIYISSNANSRQDVIFIVTVLMLGLVFESLLMIGTVSVGLAFRIGGYALRIDPGTEFGRIGGTVGSPNVAAGYLSVVMAPAISLLLTDVKRWYKRLAMVAFGLGVVGLMLTGSRGGWVACAVSMTTVYVFASRGRRIWLPVAIAGNFVVIVALLFQDVILARGNASVASRL